MTMSGKRYRDRQVNKQTICTSIRNNHVDNWNINSIPSHRLLHKRHLTSKLYDQIHLRFAKCLL